jgi:hypothetical protein
MNVRTTEAIGLDDFVANMEVADRKNGCKSNSRKLGHRGKSKFELEHDEWDGSLVHEAGDG